MERPMSALSLQGSGADRAPGRREAKDPPRHIDTPTDQPALDNAAAMEYLYVND